MTLETSDTRATVSIVMPALNNADTIAEALRSCLSSDAVREVIVVLAPSDDATADVVQTIKDPRVHLHQVPRRGISYQVNSGLDTARGPFLAKVDADDITLPGRFARQASFLAANPAFVAICGAFKTIAEDGEPLATLQSDEPSRDVTEALRRQERIAPLSSYLMRLDAVNAVGRFREWFRTAEDIDLTLRLGLAGRVWFDPNPTYGYRMRSASITHTSRSSLLEFYDGMAFDFARQRAARGSDDLDDGKPPRVPDIQDHAAPHIAARDHSAGFLETEAWRLFEDGQRRAAIRTMLRAIAMSPAKGKPSRFRSLVGLARRSLVRRTPGS